MKKAELLRLLELQEQLIEALQRRVLKLEAVTAERAYPGTGVQPYRPPQPAPWGAPAHEPWYTGSPWLPPTVTCESQSRPHSAAPIASSGFTVESGRAVENSYSY
jgi:hypothetical protein